MIQDKIFFDEKDPTGLSYNTPFTVYGSYEGRLWSKTPSGEIKYYTQNSDLSVYATTGSNSFNGNQTVTGSLTVTEGITGTATTASYVEYTGVANKPALVSGSEQVSFNGITDKPTLVSGSSQITYSGISSIPSGIVSGSAQVSFNGIVDKPTLVSGSSQITYSGISSIPAGIVSSSAQVGGYGIFATTGSNQFNGSQAVTGSLTVTGQVVAQTLNVQQVTSSIVYSSGSNIFGNTLGNTQQFTGSVSVTGSLTVAGAGTFASSVTANSLNINTSTIFVKANIADALSSTSVGSNYNPGILNIQNTNTTNGNLSLIGFQDASAFINLAAIGAINTTHSSSPNSVVGELAFYTKASGTGYITEKMRITSGGNVGIGTDSPIANGLMIEKTGNHLFLRASSAAAGKYWNFDITSANQLYIANNTFTQYFTMTDGGNFGIGTASPSQKFHVANAAGGAVAFLQSTATNGEPTLSLEGRNSSGTVRSATFKYDNADILRIGTSSPISFRFETNDTERMIIFSDGKVFIGSSSSNNGQQLRVNGNVEVTASNAFRASYDNSDNYHGALTWATLQLGNNGNNRIIGGRTAAGGFLQFYVNTTNDCTNYSTIPNGTLALTLTATGAATFSSSVTARDLFNLRGDTAANNSQSVITFTNLRSGTWNNAQIETETGGQVWAGNLVFRTASTFLANVLTERMRITSEGNLLVQKQAVNNTDTGIGWFVNDYFCVTNNSADAGDRVVLINRQNSDGELIEFRQGNVAEGDITISGTTVSYNGGHLSRYSQTELNEKIEGLLKGTVMSNLDQMAVWINPETGEPYENEQLNCMKISDIEGDKNVAGVFVNWQYDSELFTNDMNIAMTGDMIIRIAEGVVVEKGDLLISAGDGTAKPQSDDLIRSNTIAKVISNHVTCTYEDGSYCVPCVLMAC